MTAKSGELEEYVRKDAMHHIRVRLLTVDTYELEDPISLVAGGP